MNDNLDGSIVESRKHGSGSVQSSSSSTDSSITGKDQLGPIALAYSELKKQLSSTKKDIDGLTVKNNWIFGLLVAGFLVMILMVGGMVFTYWQFIFSQKNYYNSEFINKWALINDQKIRLDVLERCLSNHQYWEYKKCFNN